MSRMMAAARKPIPSEATDAVWDRAATRPPTSTCRVLSPAASTGSTRALACATVNSLSFWSSATTAYAVVPSCETWPAPDSVKGLVTPTTCGLRAMPAKTFSALAAASGVVTPAAEWTTTWTVSPARCGKLLVSVSEATFDSEPGWR
jgi:hypothetical protein